MGRLQKYGKFPYNIYYRISAELGLTLLTRNERIIVYLYLGLLLHSFGRSLVNLLLYIKSVSYEDVMNYLSSFYK